MLFIAQKQQNQSPLSVMIPTETHARQVMPRVKFPFHREKDPCLNWKRNKPSQDILHWFHATPLLLICWEPISDIAWALLVFMLKTIWNILICFAKEINLVEEVKYGLSMCTWEVSIFEVSFSQVFHRKEQHIKKWPGKELAVFTWEKVLALKRDAKRSLFSASRITIVLYAWWQLLAIICWVSMYIYWCLYCSCMAFIELIYMIWSLSSKHSSIFRTRIKRQ